MDTKHCSLHCWGWGGGTYVVSSQPHQRCYLDTQPTLSRRSSRTVFKKCYQGPQNDRGLVQYIIRQSVGLYKLNSTTSSYLTHSCCHSVLSSSDLGTPTIHSVVRNSKWLPSYWSMRSLLQAFHGSSATGCHILSYCICGVFNKWYLNDLKYWIQFPNCH